jgi:hypothetical protein
MNRTNPITEERFLQLVREHQLTIIREDGLYRHLRVGKPGTSCESWHIHTWPGYLAMVGDMGDWVFQRTDDMLCFFRHKGDGIQVNPVYWAEKLQAQEHGGWEEFDIDYFHDRIKTQATDYCHCETWDEVPEERKKSLSQILTAEDEWDAVAAMRNFDADWMDLVDFWEDNCNTVRDHFLFACYAIAWTVKLYDKVATQLPKTEAAA